MVSAQARRSQVEYASHRGVSVRRACALIGMARSTMGYEPKMPAKDGPVITVMRDLSSQYPRYGYRRIQFFGAPLSSEIGTTHSGLIHAFSQHLVKPGLVPKELGQSLARAHELRLIGDYTGDQAQATDAQTAVEQAAKIIAALKPSLT